MNTKNDEVKNCDLQVEQIDNYLQNKNIALCITGGIAAIETPKIARQLRRYGANVKAYMTKESQKFIGKASLEWATEQNVVEELSGLAEHICREDLVLIAPATANTISKITSGVADNPVTTLAASALGQKKPVLIAPCMHDSLYNNPYFKESYEKAKSHMGIIEPRFGENKAKIARTESIVAKVIRTMSNHNENNLYGKKILVTGGATPVPIDSVRMITNIFRGTLGVEIAKELYYRGADVKLLLSDNSISAPSYLDVIRHKNYDAYYKNTFEELVKNYDAGVFSAAVADYMPSTVYNGKIASLGELHLDLVQTKKVINDVREKYPSLYMVTFKYTLGKSKDELIDIGKKRSEKFDVVVANRGEEYNHNNPKNHPAYVISNNEVIAEPETKKEIAKCIADVLERNFYLKRY